MHQFTEIAPKVIIPAHPVMQPSSTLKISFQPERHYFVGKLVQIPA
jgi:hypothetical protein